MIRSRTVALDRSLGFTTARLPVRVVRDFPYSSPDPLLPFSVCAVASFFALLITWIDWVVVVVVGFRRPLAFGLLNKRKR